MQKLNLIPTESLMVQTFSIMNFLTITEMRTEALKTRLKKLRAELKTTPAVVQPLVRQNIARLTQELKRRSGK